MAAASSSYARTAPRVRWDRLGRIAMLCVLVALVYLYISAGARMFSTWRHASRDSAIVSRLEREHRALVNQHNVLSSQGALEGEARQLGLMHSGEQPYVVTHLPRD
jgi:hypothetical protein